MKLFPVEVFGKEPRMLLPSNSKGRLAGRVSNYVRAYSMKDFVGNLHMPSPKGRRHWVYAASNMHSAFFPTFCHFQDVQQTPDYLRSKELLAVA